MIQKFIPNIQSPVCLETGKSLHFATTRAESSDTICRQDLAPHLGLELSAMSLTRLVPAKNHASQLCLAKVISLSVEEYISYQLSGDWGDWEDWSECSANCNLGVTTRNKTRLRHNLKNQSYPPDVQKKPCQIECPPGYLRSENAKNQFLF